MKRIVCFCLFILFITTQAYSGIFTRYDDSRVEQIKKYIDLYKKSKSIDDKINYINNISMFSNEISLNCIDIYNKYEKSKCDIDLDYSISILVMLKINISEELLNLNRDIEAETIIKDIISTYSGTKYNKDSKRAEFMLESIKDKRNKSISSQSDIDILKLKLEIEQLKNENLRLKGNGGKVVN